MGNDYTSVFNELAEKIQVERSNLKHVNLIIAGKSGVGKSTLINAAFRENLAQTGTGKPITKRIALIEKAGVPVRIYDTVGLELDRRVQKKSLKDIKKLIAEARKSGDENEAIHCMWYCVAGNGDRFEAVEKEFVSEVAALEIPVILVLTKSYSRSAAVQLKEALQEMALDVQAIVIICAADTAEQKAYGLEELIHATAKVLPTAIKMSFSNAQKVSRDLKDKQARAVINTTVLASFGQGFIPIPFSDAPLLIASQTGMLAKITAIYDVNMERKSIETILGGFLGITGATIGGKSIVSSIFKIFPGVGTLAGGMISGTTAGTITKILGEVYIQLIHLIMEEKIDLSKVSDGEMKEIMLKLLKNMAKGK